MKRTACQLSVKRRFRTLMQVAEKTNTVLLAKGSFLEAVEALETAVRKKNIPLAHGEWFPETCHGIPLNCGYQADMVIDGQLAVIVDTGVRKLDGLEKEMQECLVRGNYLGVALVRFGKVFFCFLLSREEFPVKPGFLLSALSALESVPSEPGEA